MEKWISVLSGLFLLILAGFAWGWTAGDLGVFPAEQIRAVEAKVRGFLVGGVQDSDLTLSEKLENDMGGRPHRLLVRDPYAPWFNGCNKLSTQFHTDPEACSLAYRPGADDPFEPGYLLYGPYVDLAPGRYRVDIVYTSAAGPQAPIGRVEIVSHFGKTQILPSRTVTGSAGEKQRQTLAFALDRAHRRVEIRFLLEKAVATEIAALRISRQVDAELPHRIALDIPGLRERRETPYLLGATQRPLDAGYLLVFGSLDLESALHGLFLLDATGRVIHTIPLKDDAVRRAIADNAAVVPEDYEYTAPQVRFPHGLEILRDGSVVMNDGDAGNTIRRLDWCGEPIWMKYVRSHHAVNVAGDVVWHLEDGAPFVARDLDTGEVLRRFSWHDVLAANPRLGVLEVRWDVLRGETFPLPYHGNDIDPLPARMADAFPMFDAGDLLISARSLDLVFVLDPETLKVKWWRAGPWRRQHDPDWQPDGTITVFDNQMAKKLSAGASRIVRIDPATMATDIVYDGVAHGLYTEIRGTHQRLADGSLLVTSPQQGRAVWIDPDGRLRLDLRNAYDAKANLLLSEVRYLPPDYFTFDPAQRHCGEGETATTSAQ